MRGISNVVSLIHAVKEERQILQAKFAKLKGHINSRISDFALSSFFCFSSVLQIKRPFFDIQFMYLRKADITRIRASEHRESER